MPEARELLTQCRNLLAQGQQEKARTLVRARQTKDQRDPELHLAWAELLEELGLPEEALVELHLALRDDPERLELYERLSELYLDRGQPLKAAHLWEGLAARHPQDPRPYLEAGRAYEDAGDYLKARELYQTGSELTGDPALAARLQHLGFLEDSPAPEPPPEAAPLLPQPHHLAAFLSLFAGREGVYARQWVSPTGESGYTPVHEPLTAKVAENHLLGNHTIGIYPVRLDNTVGFIAFDLDLAKFALTQALPSQRLFEGLMAKVHKAACRLLDLAAAQDLPAYLEDSGFKGRHVWIFLEAPVPAGVAKKCADLLAARLSPLPPEVTLEVFPKQAHVKPGSLGNLIKLPLGLHRKTGRRALFLTPEGRPYDNQLDFLLSVARAPKAAVYRAVQALVAQPPPASPPAAPAPEPEPEPSSPEPAPARPAAPAPPYDLEPDPQVQHLLSRCPALREVVARLSRTGTISRDETQVLIHTLGHLEHGPQAVNELFQRCTNADPALFLKSRLKGHPMSCPKIRHRLPKLTQAVDCSCTFDLTSNLYPTPLLHLQSLGHPTPLGLTLDSTRFQTLLSDYLKLRQQLREMEQLRQRYEEQLAQIFQDAGVTELHTPVGTLRLKTDNGRLIFVLEF